MCRNDATQTHLMYFKIPMLCLGTLKSVKMCYVRWQIDILG